MMLRRLQNSVHGIVGFRELKAENGPHVCVYMCMDVCLYVYMYVHMYIYIYTHIHRHICIYGSHF